MPEETTELKAVLSSTEPQESRIFGVSVRSLVALMLVGSVCGIQVFNAVQGLENLIGEPLYGLTYLAVGYLFGRDVKRAAQPTTQ